MKLTTGLYVYYTYKNLYSIYPLVFSSCFSLYACVYPVIPFFIPFIIVNLVKLLNFNCFSVLEFSLYLKNSGGLKIPYLVYFLDHNIFIIDLKIWIICGSISTCYFNSWSFFFFFPVPSHWKLDIVYEKW